MPLLKRARIAFLLYVLLVVAAADYLTSQRVAAWEAPLWVAVYALDGDGSDNARRVVSQISAQDLAPLEDFMRREARRYHVAIDEPLRFDLVPSSQVVLPPAPAAGAPLAALWWSLRMRWLITQLQWHSDRPTPDVTLFVMYYDGSEEPTLDRSLALKKGRFAIAKVFANREMAATNYVVIAHELLHTLGATDKYDPATNLPAYPAGYAAPEAKPLYPQRRAEIMGGRIPLTADSMAMPADLDEVVVGEVTAQEIGWIKPR